MNGLYILNNLLSQNSKSFLECYLVLKWYTIIVRSFCKSSSFPFFLQTNICVDIFANIAWFCVFKYFSSIFSQPLINESLFDSY